ncbi:AbgT family transporter [Paracoccus versutus]|uniref:AbgT family transporter n=2 Tax=Paracoccus TaxID=265 RepID=UPI000225F401|nr:MULTISPECIES: AbgT family transporter [Paracoccus]RDD68490.1 AbgT family transporter [Paracoccus versutus]
MSDVAIVGKKGFLSAVERIGNRMPHPLGIFLGIIALVLLASAILSWAGVTATHPQSGEVIRVHNMLTLDSILTWMSKLSVNLQNFPVLAIVIVMAAATGIAEQVGFFTVAIKHSLRGVRGIYVVFAVACIAAVGNIAGDVSFAIVPALSASVFLGMGRHPLVGLFLGYAVVGGSFGVSVIPGSFDAILTPISIQSAHLVDVNFDMNILNGYYLLATSTVVVAVIATFVTVVFVEPRFGKYEGELAAPTDIEVTDVERRALRRSYLSVGLFLLAIIVAAIPQNSFLRSPTGSLVIDAPLMRLVFPILLIVFSLAGTVFGVGTGKIRNLRDMVHLMTEAVKTIAPFIVIAIVVSQFLYLFNESNLGAVMAIRGGQALTHLAVPVVVVLVLFFLLEAIADMFIISGSARYLIFAPVFVPMMMQLGIHPALTQAIHRMGGSVANPLTPLNAFFPVLLGLAQKYDRNVGMGTIFSAIIPYSIAYSIGYLVLIIVWYFLDLPVGFGTPISYP